MEKKFNVSLLAVSVLMGATLTTSAAFAETATEIVSKLTADTNTDLAGIRTAEQKLKADTTYNAAEQEKHAQHVAATKNKQSASNKLKDLTTEQTAVQNQAVLYLNQLYGNNTGANPTWAQVNKPSSYYITTAGDTLGTVNSAITGSANSKDSLFAKLLTSEQAVDTALSKATDGLIDKAKTVATAGAKNATEIEAINKKITYYQAVIKLAQKSNNLKIVADAAQQNLDQKKANLVKAIAENAGIDMGTKTALDTYLKTPNQTNFAAILTANTANAKGLAATASGTKVVSQALIDYSGTDGATGALAANTTAQKNYTDARTAALAGIKNTSGATPKPTDVTAAITGTGATEAVDFTKLLADYRNVIGNVTTGTPPAGSLIALAAANETATTEQKTAFTTQLATLNQAMSALQKAQQDYNTGLENAKRFQDRLTAINNSLIASNLDFSAKSLALAAAPESAAFTTHDGLVTALQTARNTYTGKLLTAVNTNLNDTLTDAVNTYNTATGEAKATARTALINDQLTVVQTKLELLSQLPKLAGGNFDGTADKIAGLKEAYQSHKLTYEIAAKAYNDAITEQKAKQTAANDTQADLTSTDEIKKAAAEKAVADLAVANFAVTQTGIALQKAVAYNTKAGVYTLPSLDSTPGTGLLDTTTKLARDYNVVAAGIIGTDDSVLVGLEDLAPVKIQLTRDRNHSTDNYRRTLNTTLNQTSHSLRAALPGMTAEARKAATDKYNAQLSLFLSDNGIGALGESVASLQTGIQAQRAASLNAGTFAAVSQADPTLYLGRADVTLNNDSIIPGYDHVIIESVPGAAGAAATLRIKNSFNSADLTSLLGATATDNPYRGTLRLEALQVNPDADTANALTLNGKDASGKSADLYFSVLSSAALTTPALSIAGNLLNDEIQVKDATGSLTSLLGGTATAPLKAQPDQIVLQNLNIHNDYQKSAQQAYIENNARAIEAAALQGITAATDAQKAAAKARADSYRSEATAALMSANPDLVGLNISASTVRQVLDNTVTVRNDIFTEEQTHSAPATANVMLSNVRVSVQNDSVSGNATALGLSGDGVHLSVTGSEISAGAAATAKKYALDFGTTGKNNLADFSNSVISGDINDSRASGTPDTPASPNEVRLTGGSVWTGNAHSTTTGTGNNHLKLVLDNSRWTGSASDSPDVVLQNNSLWTVKNLPSGNSSSANTLSALAGSSLVDLVPLKSVTGTVSGRPVNQYESTGLRVEQNLTVAEGAVLNIKIGEYNGSSHRNTGEAGLAEDYQYGRLRADGHIINKGTINLTMRSSGAEPELHGNRLATDADASAGHGHEFVLYKDFPPAGQPAVAYDPAISNSLVEAGVYQYQTVTGSSSKAGYKAIYFQNNGKLSNSAATVAGLAAAPASVAAIEGNALGKHITSLRHSEGSGVWISYYGGSNQNTLDAGPQYDLKTNGVMLGVDTAFADWMAGIAFTSGKASLSVLNSSGNVNNYGAQFWLSRHYSNGVFVDGVAQFGHYANKAKVSMIDGTPARGEYASNGYGLSAKVGYAYQQAGGFYAEPYVQATARAFSGAAYNLDNGMLVNSTDYKSFVGEIGTDLGYTVPTGAGYFKPYLHLAVLNEFANGNSVRANNIDLQNSISGAAFRIGVGGEVKLMQNLGGYLSYDYTKGSNTERPWQVNLGVNYTW